MTASRRTQAVLVIHGIGEQRPMATVRKFVNAILPDQADGPRYFSKPEPFSELFELRTLQNRTQPRTQFLEYYWAHKVTGTTFRHIWTWLIDLLWRRPSTVPVHLKPLFTAAWFLVILTIACLLGGAGETAFAQSIEVAPYLGLIAGVFLALLRWLILTHVGDAARYLSPSPANIALRREIRADGVALLRRLHESGRFDRIVVVGHSLGSIIAYDILRQFWAECHDVYTDPRQDPQAAMEHLDARAAALRQDPSPQNLDRFREAQFALWRENRSLGNPWLVTDFICLGSPLAHAALLMAQDPEDLERRQAERELPTAPPVEDSPGRVSYDVWTRYQDEDGHAHKLRAVHYGAPFAVTRWTNLFFETHFGFFGDLIGGPLRAWFGPGIHDVAVTTKRGWATQYRPRSHLSYWWVGDDREPTPADTTKDATDSVEALIYAMDLARIRTTVD